MMLYDWMMILISYGSMDASSCVVTHESMHEHACIRKRTIT
jgi:hypothetical protein